MIFCLLLGSGAMGEDKVVVQLDVEKVPEHAEWGEEVRALMVEWYPRIVNLLSSPDFEPPQEMFLTIKKSEKGVGATAGTEVTIASGWIEKNPEDVGLAIHELVHVIQGYPNSKPVWVTEGIADYIRWAIYEGKPQNWFPVPEEEKGYLKGYRVSAGFFLWLETHRAPGIVRRLNQAMREGAYDMGVFEEITGEGVDALWAQYRGG